MKQSVKKLMMLLALTGMISGCAYQFSSTNSTASSSSSKSTSSSEPVINCEHDYVYSGEAEDAPTIIQSKGAKYVCSKCGAEKYENASYDLNEYEFVDQSYMCDGSEHQLTIRGMIPYGCTVEYENNSLKEIGEKEATARVYDEKHQLVDLKKAKIHI